MNNKPLFQDFEGDEYLLITYYLTHSQLLLRQKKNKHVDHNTDIIFKSVRHLYIPTRFQGISISVMTDPDQILFAKHKYELSTDFGYKIFKLSDISGKEFYINAMAFGVFENHFELLETHLEGDLQTELNKMIFWFK